MPIVDAIHFFQRPCPAGWIYPCSLEDITSSLACLPEQDLEGLWAVGLVPATHKDADADGRYYFGTQPAIHLFSFPDTLRFKMKAHTKLSDIENGLAINCDYGMTIERQGSRYVCKWAAEDLRRFVVEFVLLHEVGHHVQFRERQQQDLPYRANAPGHEQFADDYALRWRKANPANCSGRGAYNASIP